MTSVPPLDHLTAEELRALAAQLMQRVETLDQQVHYHKMLSEQLPHEIAVLRRYQFAQRSEQLDAHQLSLLDELIDTDIAAFEAERQSLSPSPASAGLRRLLRRTALPPQFPRTLIHHEPDNTKCSCGCQLKRIGEEVSEKLDYTARRLHGGAAHPRQVDLRAMRNPDPGTRTAPSDRQEHPHTSGLLALVMVAKLADHLPLYRQERIFARASLAIPRSTLAQWVGPVASSCNRW